MRCTLQKELSKGGSTERDFKNLSIENSVGDFTDSFAGHASRILPEKIRTLPQFALSFLPFTQINTFPGERAPIRIPYSFRSGRTPLLKYL